MRIFFLVSAIFFLSDIAELQAQLYTQSGTIHTEIQVYTKEGVQINGTSKEMHIEYPNNGSKMVITIDPKTISSDNLEFNQQLENSFLGNFKFMAEVDASAFEYQSKYNEMVELEAETEINNEQGLVPIQLVVNNKKTINENIYVIVGKGQFELQDYELLDVFPNLKGELKFQFSQNLQVKYR